MTPRLRTAWLLVLLVGGCTILPTAEEAREREMLAAASALTKVSAAAEATARYGNPPDGLSDDDFLKLSVEHDPDLMKPLAAYLVKAQRKARHAVVLVCAADGSTALLEDAGCTAPPDRHRWQDTPAPACTFSLDAEALCGP